MKYLQKNLNITDNLNRLKILLKKKNGLWFVKNESS